MKENQTIKQMMDEKVFADLTYRLGYLYSRWQDEKEYEEFSDYVTNLQEFLKNKLPKGSDGTIVKMTKSPFKVIFWFRGIKLFFFVNSKQIAWGRIS